MCLLLTLGGKQTGGPVFSISAICGRAPNKGTAGRTYLYVC